MKKSDGVKSHLLICKSFIIVMMSNWMLLKDPIGSMKKVTSDLKPDFPSRSGTSLTQSSIKAFFPPPLNKTELQKIEDNIAMHYYISGSSFIRVKERHLLEMQYC
jgi:hypothetical protein